MRGHFRSEPEVAACSRYYCNTKFDTTVPAYARTTTMDSEIREVNYGSKPAAPNRICIIMYPCIFMWMFMCLLCFQLYGDTWLHVVWHEASTQQGNS